MSTIKIANPDHPIHDLIADRWSPRAFADKPVESGKILSLLEAARWSASAFNGQPWSFIVGRREDQATFDQIVSCLMPGNVSWASKAPLLMISVAHLVNPRNDKSNAYAWHDVGLAVQNMIVQASSMDLYVHQMAGFDKEKTREVFNIPESFGPVSAIAIGYLGAPETLPEDRRDMETAPRERKPLADFIFSGEWGQVSPLVSG